MKYVPLSEILTEEGCRQVLVFAQRLEQGKYQGQSYLDVHAVLRDQIRGHLHKPQENDVDYLTVVILRALRQRGSPVPDGNSL